MYVLYPRPFLHSISQDVTYHDTRLFRIVEEELIAVVGQMCHGEWDVGVDYVKSDVDKRAAANSTLHIPPKTVQTVSVSRMLELFTGLIETALRSRPIYLLLCALASACVIGIALNQRFSAYSGGDLTYFLDRTREILAHQDPYATTVAGLRVQGSAYPDIFFYNPFFYLLISPLTLLSASIAWTIWATLNGVFLLAGCAALAKAMRPDAPVIIGLLLADGVALTSMARFELYYGNVDVLLLCLLSCAFLAARHKRPVLAGVLLALSGAVYLQSLPFLLFYLWKREYRVAAIGSAGWLLLVGGSFLLVPASSLGNFLMMSGYFIGSWSANFINQSLYAVFMRLFDPIPGKATPLAALPWLPALVWISGTAATLLVAGRTIQRHPIAEGDSIRRGMEFALAVAGLALIFPVLESNTLIIGGLIMSALAVALYDRLMQLRFLGAALVVLYLISCLPLIKLMSIGQSSELHGFSLLSHTVETAPYLYIALALAGLAYVTHGAVAGGRERNANRTRQR